MVDTILSYGLAATILMGLVQYIKTRATMRNINPLFILAGLSLLGGLAYAMLVGFGYWDVITAHMLIILAAANAIWNVLNAIYKSLNPADATL